MMTDLFSHAPARTAPRLGVTAAVDFAQGWFDAYQRARARRRALREARAAFLSMTLRDDRILEDIGVTRAEVEWGARLPLERDAAREVAARSRRRRNLGR